MKAFIYTRTSTTEQFPEKQLADCRAYCVSKGFDVVGEYQEQLSGFKKNVKRENYELLKEKARKGECQAVVVWALDRWVRNRDTLLEDVLVLKNYGCKLYSVKESWLDAINIDGAIGKTIQEFLLGLIGSIAEIESQRKSDRTKMAYQNKTGRWGRKGVSQKVIDEILGLHNSGRTIRYISKNVHYFDTNNNEHNVSIGLVHKIIKNFDIQNSSLKASS